VKGDRIALPDKILVVDDESDILGLTHTILTLKGYIVVDASDGDEGLRKADDRAPDLILLDLVMQGKTGLEVCKILKDHPKTKHIPIVMLARALHS
jgi:CheY-like chemotaxis protein